jgi:hypothetical protein
MRKFITPLLVLLTLAACYQLPTPMAPPPPALLAPQNLSPETRHLIAPQWYDASGNLVWPPNGGFAAAPVAITLPPGMQLDRFGNPDGSYFSPVGTPYDMRALPYVCRDLTYTAYRVDRPLVVQSGTAAPWFGEPGGAIQYQTAQTTAHLKGYLETLPDPGPAPCDGD